MWTISYITEIDDSMIELVIELGIMKRIVDLLDKESLQIPALRAIGNIATGSNVQTQHLLNTGILSKLAKLADSESKGLRKETCWVISNIAAGTYSQIEELKKAKLLKKIISRLDDNEMEVKKEAAWALYNAIQCGNDDQVKYLVKYGCIVELCNTLTYPDHHLITVVLDTLNSLLEVGAKISKSMNSNSDENPFALEIERTKGIDAIEMLQDSENDDIYKKSYEIVEKYFKGTEVVYQAPTQQNTVNREEIFSF